MTYRKTLVAAVMTAPLFLTACGSDEDSTTDATSKAAPASDSAQTGENSSATPSGHASATPSSNASATPSDPSAAAENLNASPEPYVAPGGASTDADRQEITDLINGMDDGGDSIGNFMLYTVDHSCAAYKEANGGDELLRQQANESKQVKFSELGQPVPAIRSVNNVRVEGDRASADVVSAEGTEGMNFARENGNWTICN